ncbi:MAG: glycoside hydrolase family 3 N-terminal domain-containing protein [Bdellovibrionales bacterium]
MKPVLLGCSGPVLTQEESAFFAQLNPFGFILFQRNCVDAAQLRELTADLRRAVQRPDAPIFIDQEGGRVARLKPPVWPAFPPMRRLGVLYEQDPALGRMAVHLHALLTARMLKEVGVNGNCAPVLDLLREGASDAIGDRAISSDPTLVAAAAKVAIDTYLSHGIFPVIKHLPGHGRVRVDPHVELPFVDAPVEVLRAQDFVPFYHCAGAPIGMNCHVVFRALDPDQPVSLSAKVHREIIRGEIGFEGLLFSDDLAMGAIGAKDSSSVVRALEAGADIALYCSGNLDEMRCVCADVPDISEEAVQRWERACLLCSESQDTASFDTMQDRLATLLALEF